MAVDRFDSLPPPATHPGPRRSSSPVRCANDGGHARASSAAVRMPKHFVPPGASKGWEPASDARDRRGTARRAARLRPQTGPCHNWSFRRTATGRRYTPILRQIRICHLGYRRFDRKPSLEQIAMDETRRIGHTHLRSPRTMGSMQSGPFLRVTHLEIARLGWCDRRK